MSAAEFRTVRESLGLTYQWMANQMGVTIRALQYAESERNNINPEAKQLLSHVSRVIDLGIAKGLKIALDNGIKECTLIRYRNDEAFHHAQPSAAPLSVASHAVALSLLQRVLYQHGVVAKIHYADQVGSDTTILNATFVYMD